MIDYPISEEDRVVHLLASLPDTFSMLVTAFEANSESVPTMEVITERLLHVELKMTKKEAAVNDERRALAVKGMPKRLSLSFLLEGWTYIAGVLDVSSTGDKQRGTK